MMTINEFAEKTKVPARMLRYYELKGLLHPKRLINNYRSYNEENILELEEIKRFLAMGLKLKEISQIKKSFPSEKVQLLEKVLQRETKTSGQKALSLRALEGHIQKVKAEEQGASTHSSFSKTRKLHGVSSLGGDPRFHRTVHSINEFNIFCEALLKKNDTEYKTSSTDFLKFGQWCEERREDYDIFSILEKSSFCFFTKNSKNQLKDIEEIWHKAFPCPLTPEETTLNSNDFNQLMGPHDIVIRTIITFEGRKEEMELVFPYAPLFALKRPLDLSAS